MNDIDSAAVQSAIVNLLSSFRTTVLAATLAAAVPAEAGFLESVKGWFSGGNKSASAPRKAKADDLWLESLDQALARAKAEKKLVLLDVTGTTWCPSCVQMEKEVFTTKAFKDYAEQKLVLLRLDFPDPVIDISGKNEWVLKYLPKDGNVGLPHIVLIAPDGRALATTSYAPGGPEPFIAELEKFARK